MLSLVQHMDILAYFDIAVTFDARRGREHGAVRVLPFTFVTASQRETPAQLSQCKSQLRTDHIPLLYS